MWFTIIPFVILIFQEYLKITQPAPLTCEPAQIAFVMQWKAKICQYVHKTVQVINTFFSFYANLKLKSLICFTKKSIKIILMVI